MEDQVILGVILVAGALISVYIVWLEHRSDRHR
jgi:hypothetical protein